MKNLKVIQIHYSEETENNQLWIEETVAIDTGINLLDPFTLQEIEPTLRVDRLRNADNFDLEEMYVSREVLMSSQDLDNLAIQ